MRDGDVITRSVEAADSRFLRSHGQEAGEDTFGAAPLVVGPTKTFGSIADLGSDRGRQPNEHIAAFLGEVLRMLSRAE